MNHCKDCKHYVADTDWNDLLKALVPQDPTRGGECHIPSYLAMFGAFGQETEGIWVLPEFGCIQFEAKMLQCEDCRKDFSPATQHKRKFCSVLCAKRKTGREWKRRMRAVARSRKP